MTDKEKKQFNYMFSILYKIAKHYDTVNWIKKQSKDNWWLTYEEALEMSYENVKSEAKYAIKWVKPINI